MKSMKYLLTTLFALGIAHCCAYADDGNTLYCFTKSSTAPYTISLDDLRKLTFSASGVQLWSNYGMSEVPFGDFLLIAFSEMEHPYISAVELPSLAQDMQMRYIKDSRTLVVESSDRLDGVSVYDLQGRMVCSETSASFHYNLNLSALPKGAYVVKITRYGRIMASKIVL